MAQPQPADPREPSHAAGPGVVGSPESGRRYGRILIRGAASNLGQILDISAGGMRVASRAVSAPPRKGATIPVQIDVGDDEWKGVTCRVAWVRSTGVMKREIGLEFVEIDDDVRRALLAMAHTSGSAGCFRLTPESERDRS